jgi:hypothetical protein
MREFYDLAPALVERGWRSLVPIRYGQKRPAIEAWTDLASRAATEAEIALWRLHHGGCGIGLVFGPDRVVGIDLDWRDEATAREAFATAARELGPTPLVRVGEWPKNLLHYAVAPGFHEPSTRHAGFETFTAGGQCVLFGRHPRGRHPRGFDYTWPNASPLDVAPHELPRVDGPRLCALRTALYKLAPPTARPATPRPAAPRPVIAHGRSSDQTSGVLADFAPLLRAVPDEERLTLAARLIVEAVPGTRYRTMSGVIFALVVLGAEDAEVRQLLPVYLGHYAAADLPNRAAVFEGGLRWARRTFGPSRTELLADPLLARLRAGWRAARAPSQNRISPWPQTRSARR